MNAQIDQRTAAGLSLGGEPAALAGDTAAADPSAASAVDVAALAGGDDLLQVLGVGVVAVVSHDHENAVVLFACRLHFLRFLNGNGVRLLAEYVQTALHRVNGDDGMEVVRGGDVDGVKLFVVDHLLEIGVSLCVEVVFFDGVGGSFLDDVAESDDFNAGIAQVAVEVMTAHAAETDHTDTEFLFHDIFLFFYGRSRIVLYIR